MNVFVYSMRDIKSDFMAPTYSSNDAVAMRNRASFPCKTLPEAKRTAVAVQELVVTSDEYIRVVKEIDF